VYVVRVEELGGMGVKLLSREEEEEEVVFVR